jgi:hypothetical protein
MKYALRTGIEKDIEPHGPVWDKTERKDDSLQQRTWVTKANTIIYRSSQAGCATCPLKATCCP